MMPSWRGNYVNPFSDVDKPAAQAPSAPSGDDYMATPEAIAKFEIGPYIFYSTLLRGLSQNNLVNIHF